MSGKFEEMINNAKITELLNRKKAEEENKSFVLWFGYYRCSCCCSCYRICCIPLQRIQSTLILMVTLIMTSLRMISKMTTLMIMTFM